MLPEKKKTILQQIILNRKPLLITAVILLCLLLIVVTRCETAEKTPLIENSVQPDSDSLRTRQLIFRIQQCSRLYTTQYEVHKIITHEDSKRLRIGNMEMELPMTDRRIAIPIDATIKAYVDMGGFSEANIRTDGVNLVVTLPDPRIEVTSTIVNHDKTLSDVSLIRSNYTVKEQESFHRQGLMSITQNMVQSHLIEDARLSAARTLVPILTRFGYDEQNIQIRFSKEKYSLSDLPRLIDSNVLKFNTKKK